jgi:alpha-galactosidase
LIHTPYFRLQFNSERGTFDLYPETGGMPRLENARVSVSYTAQGRPFSELEDGWEPCAARLAEGIETAHGPVTRIAFSTQPGAHGLSYCITFALAEERPLFLWKMSVQNEGKYPVWIDRIQLLDVGENGGHWQVCEAVRPARFSFHSNNWQSWGYTATYMADRAPFRSRMPQIHDPLCANPGTPQPHHIGHFASDFYGVIADRANRKGMVLGFLSQKQHFGSVEALFKSKPILRLWANGDHTRLDPGQQMETDWAVIYPFLMDINDSIGPYLDAVARENGISIGHDAPVGWCSWYHYFQKVTAEDVRQNLNAIVTMKNRLPLELVQIDDGFESQVGDWFTFRKTFPKGVAPLAKEIKAAGLMPGLWLAPFIVHPKAALIKEHPEFLLRTEKGKLVNAGYIWNTFTTALDLTAPGALDYVCKVVDTAAHAWGFSYLKLDFLYAGALTGQRHDMTRTRAQVLRKGLEAIREAAGEDTYMVGCGAPLGPSLGIFNAMRIGEDVSPTWMPHFNGIKPVFKDEKFIPSMRNALNNIISRAPLHKHWWINDPDCLLVRDETKLSLAEVQLLATAVGMTGGSMLLSDNLTALSEERLRIAESLLPVIGQRAEVVDWLDSSQPSHLRLDLQGAVGSWYLLAYLNWQDKAKDLRLHSSDFHLPNGTYWVRSFWDGEVGWLDPLHPVTKTRIPAHGVVLLAVRKLNTSLPQYLGSDLHFSQGLEVVEWEVSVSGLRFRLDCGRDLSGHVDLCLPSEPKAAHCDHRSIQWQQVREDVYRLPVVGKKSVTVQLDL